MIEHSMPTIWKEEQRAIIDVVKTDYLIEGDVVIPTLLYFVVQCYKYKIIRNTVFDS